MSSTNRQIILAARPIGFPKESDLAIIESPMPSIGPGQFLVRSIYLSVDPYMRGRMNDRKSYADPVGLGQVMTGIVAGRVVESNHAKFKVGAYVVGQFGWQDFAVSDGTGVHKVDPTAAPLSAYLGVLGMPGLTAYFGLIDIGQPQAGQTVLVSGAAGAVGLTVGQIARIHGCHVVGVAGTDEKVQLLKNEFGFDAAFNYRDVENYVSKLKEVCPRGIDIFFDNVGGELTDAAFQLLNLHARVAICGQISQYNLEKPELGPRLLWKLIETRAKVQGFLVFDYANRFREATVQLAEWIRAGQLKFHETISEGLENAPRAFLGMLRGENIGKQLVRVSES